ncbi:YlzJ-like family protein [Sutcliffiella horikoshii]|uniref:YlzJ-like family protein n=1 Tax=Sutcliffiella horikoshii TaxID=79883 RepID=UPI001F24AB59|nr:YlzJ-like family protein [Sutcliffiella horikoshii]MCG1020706.1 ribonuclease [Sutcliffiella horikoshii]
MILYTTMPQELIFPVENGEFEKQRVIDFNGVSLMVQQTDMNAYQIVRNLSTDPAHYLSSEYSPGQTINFL